MKEEDVSVRQAGFQTWAYLVAKLARAHLLEDNEVFEQVVTSYLIHVIRDSEPEIYNLGFEAAGLCINCHWRYGAYYLSTGLLIAPEADEQDNERALVHYPSYLLSIHVLVK